MDNQLTKEYSELMKKEKTSRRNGGDTHTRRIKKSLNVKKDKQVSIILSLFACVIARDRKKKLSRETIYRN